MTFFGDLAAPMEIDLIDKAILSNMARVPIQTGALGIDGDEDLVAAVADNRIRVLQMVISATAVTNFKLRSGTTDLTGDMEATTASIILPFHPLGWLETEISEGLNLLNGPVGAAYDGFLLYALIS